MSPPHKLILASASPRRRMLLPLVGEVVGVTPAEVDETPRPGEGARELAGRLAIEKAECAFQRLGTAVHEATVVVAADTVVSLDGQPLGKPSDAVDAWTMLDALRGRAHEVISGVATRFADESGPRWTTVSTSVLMRAYDDWEIETYINRGEPFDKAGGYAIQDPEFRPVQSLHGCLPNVVGLPLCAVQVLLDRPLFGHELEAPATACDLCQAARQRLREHGLWAPPDP